MEIKIEGFQAQGKRKEQTNCKEWYPSLKVAVRLSKTLTFS